MGRVQGPRGGRVGGALAGRVGGVAIVAGACALGEVPGQDEASRIRKDADGARVSAMAASGAFTAELASEWVSGRTATVLLSPGELVPDEVCASTGPRCARWVPWQRILRVDLPGSRARQELRVLARSAAGEPLGAVSLTVQLDRQAPRMGPVEATPALGGATLRWPAAVDKGAGVVGYRVAVAEGARAPDCDPDVPPAWEGPELEAALTGLPATPHTARVCAVDGAGNVSAGQDVRWTPDAEVEAPVVRSFALAEGAAITRQREVPLTLVADDASGIATFCASEAADDPGACPWWRPYAEGPSVELSGGEGPKAVRVWLRDPHGNTSAAVEDTIVFDRTPPEATALELEVTGDAVDLRWAPFPDALSGLVGYVVVTAPDRAPDSCAEGTELARSADESLRVEGLSVGVHGFRVCGIDAAGNISIGATGRARVRPTLTPPTITRFAQVDGATSVCGGLVDLKIEATADAELIRMCVEESTSCSSWVPWAEARAWRLSPGDGPKTLYAWVRDADGSETPVPTPLEIERVSCAPELELSALALDLGPICGPTDTALTVTNTGSAPLVVRGAAVEGAAWSTSAGGFPWTLQPGEARDVDLLATPGEGTLVLTTDVDGARRLEVPLSARADAPPTLELVGPADGAVLERGAVAALEARVFDPDTDARQLTVTWESDVDGVFAEVTPDGDGLAAARWQGVERSPGAHQLTATVTDACGATAEAAISVCQDEGYTADELDISTWTMRGTAVWDAANGWVQLTAANRNEAGTAFQTATTVSSAELDVSVRFYMSGGSGADGLTLTALDAARMRSFVGGAGGGMGYSGLPGWTVEVDNYFNSGTDPTREDHVSVHIDGVQRSYAAWAALPDMEDGRWHTLRVKVVGTRFQVWVDGAAAVDATVAGLREFPAYIGFTASTGGATNWHRIDSLDVAGFTCDR